MPLAQPHDDVIVFQDVAGSCLAKTFFDPCRLQLSHLKIPVYRLVQQIGAVTIVLLGIAIGLILALALGSINRFNSFGR